MIYKINNYSDEEGRNILEKVPFLSLENKNRLASDDTFIVENANSIKEGIFNVQTPMGAMQINFEFPNDLTLEKCFEKFDELAQQKIQDIEKEMQKQIIIPGQQNSDIIIS